MRSRRTLGPQRWEHFNLSSFLFFDRTSTTQSHDEMSAFVQQDDRAENEAEGAVGIDL
jgi:hypothetical protein